MMEDLHTEKPKSWLDQLVKKSKAQKKAQQPKMEDIQRDKDSVAMWRVLMIHLTLIVDMGKFKL